MTHPLSIGTRIRHPQYGDGLILDNTKSFYNVSFPNFGEKSISKDFEQLEIIELAPLPENRVSIGDVEKMMAKILQKWTGLSKPIHLGNKWKGGTLILKPGNPDLKAKEIPIETFFHKIVMVRDRIRVLEQNINKSKNLSDEEKVNIQQYITRVYGSLTTFNVLFALEEDQFRGEGKRS